MEPKKNPKKDLNKNRGLYFVSGLALIMMLTYVALEWKTYDSNQDYNIAMNITDDLIEPVPITEHFKTPPPPPPPVAPPVIEIEDNDADIEETVIESSETNQEEEVYEIEEIEVAEVNVDIKVIFTAVEDAPVFPGCENKSDKKACFQKMMIKHINRNIRYPEIAKEMNLQGRVSTVFVIQKDGTISDLQLKGPHVSLEKEATRILKKLPKMKPGKQRGTPVKVSFSQPITFKLQ